MCAATDDEVWEADESCGALNFDHGFFFRCRANLELQGLGISEKTL
jgi:hypothetical protein